MAKRMLIDAAHPEETRVVVLSGNRLEEFDFESSTKKQVKGNIYLAKITRVEPSLQAAFVDYGGNRHGFLAFSEIHPDYYRIPVGDRETGEFDAPPPEIGTTLPDIELPETVGEAPAEIVAGLPQGEPEAAAEGPEPTARANEPDDAPVALADALPEAVPVPEAPEPEPEPQTEIEDTAAPAETIEAVVAAEMARDDSIAEALPDDVADVEMADPIESVVSNETYFDSAPPAAEDVETLDDDEVAEEAGAERRRSHSLRHYKIQEVVKRRQIMLVQVAKEERGNKGAALTTYLSLAGRYCVLMPNTARGGGVSRKITSVSDRRRLKDILEDLDIPEGMGVIVRTAGSERSKAEIKRDYEYLMRLWSEIRELTLKSTAPALIYEEGNLIKRSIRDLYARDIDEVIVEGEEGYRTAKAFMRMLTPSHAKRVQSYRDPLVGLFQRYQVESQIDAAHSPIAQLRSGGYIVINQTEALVSIDVNSGRATRERNIEETALRTNLEAADEIARQLRLRDLAGLIVIDFIDMEEHRHNAAVERRLKEALKNDRARIQVGRISAFGLLEMSRQRLRPSLAEASTEICKHCGGTGFVRSTESAALYVLRSIEEEGARARSAEIYVHVPTTVALYILNQKRDSLAQIELRYRLRVMVGRDDTLVPPNFRLERLRALEAGLAPLPRPAAPAPMDLDEDEEEDEEEIAEAAPHRNGRDRDARSDERKTRERGDDERGSRRGRRRHRGRRGGEEGREQRRPEQTQAAVPEDAATSAEGPEEMVAEAVQSAGGEHGDSDRRRRRRGRRGGRWRNREEAPASAAAEAEAGDEDVPAEAIEPAAVDQPELEQPIDQPAEEEVAEFVIESAPVLPPDPQSESESKPEPVRELETVGAGNGGAAAEAAPRSRRLPPAPPEGIDVHAVTQKPAAPRRGWWTRLIQ